VATRLGVLAEVMHAVAPKVSHIVMNTAYRLYPESAAALGKQESTEKLQPSAEQIAFAELTRGFHF
jgi:hypothetical protein